MSESFGSAIFGFLDPELVVNEYQHDPSKWFGGKVMAKNSFLGAILA